MRKLLCSALVSVALVGCDELSNATTEVCAVIVEGCALTIAESADYCMMAVGDEPGDISELCDAYYRGQMCQCLTPACVRDVVYHGHNHDKWAREFVNSLECPAAILSPYEKGEAE